WEHIFFSAIHSLKAFKQGINILNNLELEILLYVSGQHQIKVAIEKFGIDLETQNIAIIILGKDINSIENARITVLALIEGIENEAVLTISKEKYENICKNFNISQLEIETVANSSGWKDKLDAIIKIVLNRIAFVIFEK
ncbi:MAG: KEOPS complex subunit Cgi121, partial [Promethearchaeota archaeon]